MYRGNTSAKDNSMGDNGVGETLNPMRQMTAREMDPQWNYNRQRLLIQPPTKKSIARTLHLQWMTREHTVLLASRFPDPQNHLIWYIFSALKNHVLLYYSLVKNVLLWFPPSRISPLPPSTPWDIPHMGCSRSLLFISVYLPTLIY